MKLMGWRWPKRSLYSQNTWETKEKLYSQGFGQEETGAGTLKYESISRSFSYRDDI